MVAKGSRTKAFTLIELLVVILIIGILAAVAVPQYQVARHKTRISALLPIAKDIKDAQEVYYMANGTYVNAFEKLGIDIPCQISATDKSFASCKFGQIDNIVGGLSNPTDLRVGIVYNPGNGGNTTMLISFYLEHSSRPMPLRVKINTVTDSLAGNTALSYAKYWDWK